MTPLCAPKLASTLPLGLKRTTPKPNESPVAATLLVSVLAVSKLPSVLKRATCPTPGIAIEAATNPNDNLLDVTAEPADYHATGSEAGSKSAIGFEADQAAALYKLPGYHNLAVTVERDGIRLAGAAVLRGEAKAKDSVFPKARIQNAQPLPKPGLAP
jgi:hypothetical protein